MMVMRILVDPTKKCCECAHAVYSTVTVTD